MFIVMWAEYLPSPRGATFRRQMSLISELEGFFVNKALNVATRWVSRHQNPLVLGNLRFMKPLDAQISTWPYREVAMKRLFAILTLLVLMSISTLTATFDWEKAVSLYKQGQ